MSKILIKKEKLKKLIEPHYYKNLVNDEYKLKTINANQLLTFNRFDLCFKLMFLEKMEYDPAQAMIIYKEHIRSLTLGKFSEPGSLKKNSFEKYIQDFESLLNDIRENGFKKNKSLIPLSSNGSIANGSHRASIAIFFNKKVDCVDINVQNHLYDYIFFYKRKVSTQIMDAAANTFIKYAKNVYIAIIWPSAIGRDKELHAILDRVVYLKNVKLNRNGAHNLISQVYFGEDWLGSVKDNYKGSDGKLIKCFKSFDPVKFIAFQSTDEEVVKIKQRIRSLFNLGKHSVHITDNHSESLRVSRLAFNDNSIHFLNYSKPNKFLSTHKKIDNFKLFLKENQINEDSAILDSSIVLSAYGLREAKDTDFLINKSKDIKFNFDSINNHEEVLNHYGLKKAHLIYSPDNYFYFNDVKFTSFSNLYDMKLKRGETKDQNDLMLMEALIESNTFKENYAKLKQFVYYEKIKSRQRALNLLKALGLYIFLKKIYKGLKK